MRTAAIGVLALALTSCGGGGGGSCGKVEPCGGPVAGTWKASASCSSSSVANSMFQDGLMGSCPTATASAESGSPTGTLALNADLSYTMSLSVPFVFHLTVPASCLNGGSCADLAAAVSQSLTDGTVTCAGSSSCNCTLITTSTMAGTGTYTTSGTTLTLTDASGSANDGTYCVQGNTLHLVDVDTTMNMGPMGQATITDDVTLSKQ